MVAEGCFQDARWHGKGFGQVGTHRLPSRGAGGRSPPGLQSPVEQRSGGGMETAGRIARSWLLLALAGGVALGDATVVAGSEARGALALPGGHGGREPVEGGGSGGECGRRQSLPNLGTG